MTIKQIEKAENKQFIQRLLALYGFEKKQMIHVFFLRICYEISKLIPPILDKYIIDILVSLDQSKLSLLMILVGGVFVINALSSVFSYYMDKRSHNLFSHLFNNLKVTMLGKLMYLPVSYHEGENTHRKMSKIGRSVDRFENFTVNVVYELVPTLLQTLITFFVVFAFNWKIALLFPIYIPLFLYVTWHMNKKARPHREVLREHYHERFKKMGESLSHVQTIQEYSQEEREKGKTNSITQIIIEQEEKRQAVMRTYDLVRDVILNTARVSTLAMAVYLTFTGTITAGSLVMFLTYSEKVYLNLFRLSRFYDSMADCIPAVNDIAEILEQDSPIKDIPDAVALNSCEGDIQFTHVSFAYNKTNDVLHDISFEVHPREIIALVGPSGSGKSTIIKLLYRHFDVESGEITLDHHNIKTLQRSVYRRRMAIVPQDIAIFDDTIAENVRFSSPEATQKEIEQACKDAFMHDFILTLPEEYASLVGERGIRLSGGQKQRLGIARALVAKPSILILDEATSSLDSESELLIQQAIKVVARQCTMIIIAHRLSTVRHADKILVLDKGKIMEQGTHDMLKNQKGGLYARLYTLQSEGVLV